MIRDGRIAEVGRRRSVTVPAGARRMDLAGHTVIPGIVGMHDHLFYTAVGGRAAQMSFTGPRLYLASGVTTIRTTGGRAPYAELNARAMIDSGRVPGPRIHFTAPYLTGDVGGAAGSMAQVGSPDAARRFVAYWAQEGATWIKIYTDIRRAELAAAIDEAHKRGIKVTGHLCSVTFQEAADLGIDGLEHGLLTATDFDAEKKPDHCPSNSLVRTGARQPVHRGVEGDDQEDGRQEGRHDVHPRRVRAVLPEASRVRRAHAGDDDAGAARLVRAVPRRHREQQELSDSRSRCCATRWRSRRSSPRRADCSRRGWTPPVLGGALPGFGDQRNYELLIEAGFTPAQTVQVMSLNGARILGIADRLGSVEQGKIADLVVLQGDLAAEPAAIRRVTTVFKDGVGYDSPRLLAAVKGRVGID